jgi:hypothetical protein
MTLAPWNPDIPFALLIVVLCVAMFIPEIISGIRTYFRGRDLARELYRESDKSRLFDQDRDDWK